ncbi:DUF4397 domain-containing protein [Naasia lichenicola]|uniref:DUF4397 domain-containing protein n=1 Tax=Naasia lichenicola TaxID=2565933 RepID=A0A4S4FG66_9MICO|nr:DUF4397 domain-containing protein [Naasia lichenicola]THG28752.1 DUF4397 domain-containing protein [Naasia lichenicola]
MNRRITRPLAALGAIAAAVGLALIPVAPAAAVENGYVRVAHLSPDTLEVDVTLSSLSGGTVLYKLSNVGYGGVSKYMSLPAGTYAIAMVPSAGGATTPLVSASIDVTAGKAETVAALGRNANLSTQVVSDDLAAPTGSQARVRTVQASVNNSSLSVKTTAGLALASNASFGAVSSYTDVPSGSTTFDLTAGSLADTASADLAAGSTQTLFVLDTAAGGLTVVPVLDSVALTETPVGGVSTGGGALAVAEQQQNLEMGGGILSAAVLLAGIAALLVRSRRRAATAVARVE